MLIKNADQARKTLIQAREELSKPTRQQLDGDPTPRYWRHTRPCSITNAVINSADTVEQGRSALRWVAECLGEHPFTWELQATTTQSKVLGAMDNAVAQLAPLIEASQHPQTTGADIRRKLGFVRFLSPQGVQITKLAVWGWDPETEAWSYLTAFENDAEGQSRATQAVLLGTHC